MKKFSCLWVGISLVSAISLLDFTGAYAAPKPIDFQWSAYCAIATCDPAQMNSNPTYALAPNIYDTLLFPDPEKGYIPWIAESWEVSADGTKYTFHLKKGVPFHDDREVTAEDVVFSIDRLKSMRESTLSNYFKSIKPGSTKAPGKYTVEFNLTERTPEFMVSLFLLKIMNKKLILENKKEGNYGAFGDYGIGYLHNHDAGSGPFTVMEHKHGNYLTLKRFEKYPFTPRKPNSIDTVTIRTIPEEVTSVTMLKAGQLDMGESTLPAMAMRDLQKNKNFLVSEQLVTGLWTCVMNNAKKPLDDPNVRKACAHAFDVEVVTNQILAGGKRAQGPLPESMSGGCRDIVSYPYDLEKAKELLKKSKYSAEELKTIEMELAGGITDRFNRIMLMFYSNLKKIGLNPKIVTTTWPDMCKREMKPETAFHFALITGFAILPHPIYFLNNYTKEGWGKASPWGGMYYSNPKVDDALKMAAESADLNIQKQHYCVSQKLIAEDSPAIFSHTNFVLLPMWRYVKGYKYPVGSEAFEFRFDRLTMDTEDPLFRKNHGW
jgi:peptide/nickel transport system substrate-binding protein